MHDILGKKPEIQPPAMASTSSGLHLLEDPEETPSEGPPPRKKCRPSKDNAHHSDERLRVETEKVEQLRTFNELFKDYLQMKKAQMFCQCDKHSPKTGMH